MDDLPARFGGEEFALIVEDTDEKGAFRIAKAVRLGVIELQLENLHSTVLEYVTVSSGIATITPNSEIDADEIIHRADQALYEAKKGGRNQIVISRL